MTGRASSFLRLRWLAVVLLSLIWATMGRAAALAERSDFGQCVIAANRGAGLADEAVTLTQPQFIKSPSRQPEINGEATQERRAELIAALEATDSPPSPPARG